MDETREGARAAHIEAIDIASTRRDHTGFNARIRSRIPPALRNKLRAGRIVLLLSYAQDYATLSRVPLIFLPLHLSN